ncbi:Acyl-phosphate:glycerol-3-phosphate O-acyltransferase PlsY [Pseudoalteromonas luteoviolacea B = ATCC 29581]|nr:Acyl-phosphate:glycerol-3-phosphate O-acyltransferase PlsY [Pseudoalteromonas luteoviolacea B = ATCC 29581]
MFRLPDPRFAGSNNPGATNVLRLGGKIPAALVLACDVLKGTIPVWGAYFLAIEPIWLGAIAVSACLGHIYPIFFHFNGGKAVATAFGALLPIGLSLAGMLIVTWLVVLWLTRYSSLAAIVTVSLAPVYTFLVKPLYTLPVTFLTIVIIFRHRANIARLWQGKEPKITKKSERQ